MPSIDNSQVVLSWGISVTLGWIATALMGVLQSSISSVMTVWSILTIIPILLTLKIYLDNSSNKLFNFWAILTFLVMIENFLTPVSVSIYSYFHLWIAVGVIGFYYTSKHVPNPSKKIYRNASISSLIALIIGFFQPLTIPLMAIFVQGVPILYDWLKVHR